jgi:hypothetical protein
MAKKEVAREDKQMSPEDARAFRASLYRPTERALMPHEKREKFRVFWAANRNKYGKAKNLEEVLWVHLVAMKLDDPNKFEEGLKNFGLKKVK